MITKELKTILGDVLGGINAAIVALPQALAFGVAAGVTAMAGIWGTIILCFTAAIFSGRVPLISGITGPVTIVVASVLQSVNADISILFLIILFAGIIQMILAFTPFSSVIKYIPYPVISGFLNGIGVIIILMQLNPIIGHPVVSNIFLSIGTFINNLHNINSEALFIGLLTLIIVFALPKKFNKIIPSQAIALVVCTIVSIKFNFNIERISDITFMFPSIEIPQFNLRQIITYAHYSVILAIVLSAESLLTLLVSDSLLKTKSSSKKMLFSQGIGNIFCSLTGSLPGACATLRTVAAINSGAKTNISAIVCSLILLILLYKFSGFAAQIPLAVLSGILIKVGYDIIDTKLLKVIKYAPRDDLYVLWLVFILTVFYNLIVAVGAGIVAAAILYAKRVADETKLVHKTVYDEDIIKLEKELDENYKHKIRVVHIDGQFFFGSATQLVSQFEEIWGTKYLILDYSAGKLLDISAIFALEDIIIRLKAQKINIFLVITNDYVMKQLKEHGIISQIGEKNVFFSELEAINYIKNNCNLRS